MTAEWSKLERKLIAILRGIKPEETEAIMHTLLESGFEAIEIPLNSPDPYRSIEIAAKTVAASGKTNVFIGAGTVLSVEEVNAVASAGGNIIVSPNTDVEVIARTRELGLLSMPGVFTPTEAHIAVKAGVSALKFFPASVLGPEGVKAIKAILPPSIDVCAVGGVGPDNFSQFLSAGVVGFGIGSNLYKPGTTPEEIKIKAMAILAAWDQAVSN